MTHSKGILNSPHLKENQEISSKRLFLFASFCKSGVLGKADLNYIRSLSATGDVVFFADCSLGAGELDRLRDITLHAEAYRHGEYDFGSYKRGFLWASGNLDIETYDYVYLVNDSVFCVVRNLSPFLDIIESKGNDFTGMVFKPSHKAPHIQSWFVGIGRDMFMRPEFDAFIRNIQQTENKIQVCIRYETGLTELAVRMGYVPDALLKIRGKGIYNDVRKNLERGLPFIKKSSFVRHNCSLSAQINKMLACVPQELVDDIFDEIKHDYGEETFNRSRCESSFKCTLRGLKYCIKKIRLF